MAELDGETTHVAPPILVALSKDLSSDKVSVGRPHFDKQNHGTN